MTLDEAIEILNLSKEPDFEGDSNDFYKALQLGLEALKRINAERRNNASLYNYELDGETKE